MSIILPGAQPFGSGDAPPVLLLHGFLGRGTDWDPVASQLAPTFRLWAPDLPGHGRATALPAEAYTMDGAAEALVATLDTAAVGRAAVVGYSMGGRLALHFALRHPARVARLILLSASPGLRSEAERAERRILDAERADSLVADLPAFLQGWYRMPLFETLTEDTRNRLIQERRHNDPTELGKSLTGMGTGAQPSHWEHLRRIRVPAWALVGSRDAKYVRIAEQMAEAGPFDVMTMPSLGHALIEEQPHALTQVLHRLLNRPITHSPDH
ncbi:MAG: 2-succinyl-6-hydroxy-2,4-cyclohexadiene-1-carboxylate synthase [Rhodothermaceae bacterium]|nr:2-succinyl-6-hydroxy-2,4-cyclohexadiene-1-carboxylate synthase [Rhodothermaceae bacterium]